MQELIGLIKQIKKLSGRSQQQVRMLEQIYSKWLMLLNESPVHSSTLNALSMDNLKQNIDLVRNDGGLEINKKIICTRYDKAKMELILLITEQIKNPD